MKRLLAIAGVLLIFGGAIYALRPTPHIPPFDADLKRLAETPLEGYCSGKTFWNTRGEGDAEQAEMCRAEERAEGSWSEEVDLSMVQFAFCSGAAAAGFAGDVYGQCVVVLEAYQLWPTYDGQLSQAWNKAHPYPLKPAFSGAPTDGSEGRAGDSESRTGNRNDQETGRLR